MLAVSPEGGWFRWFDARPQPSGGRDTQLATFLSLLDPFSRPSMWRHAKLIGNGLPKRQDSSKTVSDETGAAHTKSVIRSLGRF
jgi:hypothetical protein